MLYLSLTGFLAGKKLFCSYLFSIFLHSQYLHNLFLSLCL